MYPLSTYHCYNFVWLFDWDLLPQVIVTSMKADTPSILLTTESPPLAQCLGHRSYINNYLLNDPLSSVMIMMMMVTSFYSLSGRCSRTHHFGRGCSEQEVTFLTLICPWQQWPSPRVSEALDTDPLLWWFWEQTCTIYSKIRAMLPRVVILASAEKMDRILRFWINTSRVRKGRIVSM